MQSLRLVITVVSGSKRMKRLLILVLQIVVDFVVEVLNQECLKKVCIEVDPIVCLVGSNLMLWTLWLSSYTS
jgi:hypothetical protein